MPTDVFSLRVSITGLCLLAHDDNDGLYLVMPRTGAGKPVPHVHAPVLAYDKGYLSPNGTLGHGFDTFPLDEQLITLDGDPMKDPFVWNATDDVLDLTDVFGANVKLDRRFVSTTPPGKKVVAIAHLRAGAATCVEAGNFFTVPGKGSRHIAFALEWSMRVNGTSLKIPATGLNGVGARQPPELFAHGRQLRLTIAQQPVGAVNQPNHGDQVVHFRAHYDLLNLDDTKLPLFDVESFKGGDCIPPLISKGLSIETDAFTCMPPSVSLQ
jgi:hypothetical protein